MCIGLAGSQDEQNLSNFFYYPSLFPSPTVNFLSTHHIFFEVHIPGGKIKQGCTEMEFQHSLICVCLFLRGLFCFFL